MPWFIDPETSWFSVYSFPACPNKLVFMWWGCCSLCSRHKPIGPVLSFCSCVYFCLYGHFTCISFHKFSGQLAAFLLCSSGLISAVLVLSTIYLFMTVSLSPDVLPCGWLGWKHQLTNTFSLSSRPDNPQWAYIRLFFTSALLSIRLFGRRSRHTSWVITFT